MLAEVWDATGPLGPRLVVVLRGGTPRPPECSRVRAAHTPSGCFLSLLTVGRRVFKLAPYGQPGGGRTPSQPNLKRRCTQRWSALPPHSLRECVRTFGRLCGTKLTLRPIQIQQNFNGPHSRQKKYKCTSRRFVRSLRDLEIRMRCALSKTFFFYFRAYPRRRLST